MTSQVYTQGENLQQLLNDSLAKSTKHSRDHVKFAFCKSDMTLGQERNEGAGIWQGIRTHVSVNIYS